MANLEPAWVSNVETWWQNLLGPTLSSVWAQVKKNAGSNGMLEKAHGEAVRRFEQELAQLEEDVGVFEALAGSSEWAPFGARARDVLSRVKAQWKDPAATEPASVSGPLLSGAKAVVRGINVTVSAIGVAWAVASLAEVLHTRKLLRRWAEHVEQGVHPSKRDRRQARIQGVEVGRGGFRRAMRRVFRPGRQRRRAAHGPRKSGRRPDGELTARAKRGPRPPGVAGLVYAHDAG